MSILGPGLLGGSLALALKKYCPEIKVCLWGRREESLQTASNMQAADMYTIDLPDAATWADLIVLAVPVGVMLPLVKGMEGFLKSGRVLVTDVGSVKSSVHREVGKWLSVRGIDFIGSHPMAGSEKQGIEYAEADLFWGAMVAMTNEEQCPTELVERLAAFWKSVGGRVMMMHSDEHDRVVARISHLPHALAATCSRAAYQDCESIKELLKALAAGGFRDTTRVSMGKPSMWAEIMLENKQEMLLALEVCLRELTSLRKALQDDNFSCIQSWLQQAGERRRLIYPEDKA